MSSSNQSLHNGQQNTVLSANQCTIARHCSQLSTFYIAWTKSVFWQWTGCRIRNALIQKWAICWEELHHHTRVYCKPLIDKVRVVQHHILQNNYKIGMTGLNSRLSSGGISFSQSAFRNVMRRSVLYGPIVGIWHRTPSLGMAARTVMLAPLCPETVKVGLYPVGFFPHLLFYNINGDTMCPQLQAPLFSQ